MFRIYRLVRMVRHDQRFLWHFLLKVKHYVCVISPQDVFVSTQLENAQDSIVPLQVVTRHLLHVIDCPLMNRFVGRVKDRDSV
jgi:hypothetical protein